jgi:branched-chain amino acid aminotransferase
VDLGVDFVVSFDDRGCLAEGPTENVGIVTTDRELLFPTLDCILAGTTMLRVLELAQELVKTGELRKAGLAPIPRNEVTWASEMLIVGTTPNVAMVREFDGKPIGSGKPGPIYRKLRALLLDDIHKNRKMLTTAFSAAEIRRIAQHQSARR